MRDNKGHETKSSLHLLRDILPIAFRNLSRHRVKSIITITGVAISVGLYIFMDAWLLGMNLDSRRNIVSYEMGAAKIQTRAYFEKKDDLPLYEGFSEWLPLIEALEKAGYVAAPRVVFTGTLYTTQGSAPIVFYGVDPTREQKVLRYTKYLEQGRFPEPGKFELALGLLAAEKLKIDLTTRSKEDVRISAVIDLKDEKGRIRHVYQVIEAQVVGVINSPNPKTNGNVAYLPLDVLQGEEGLLLEGQVTEIIIRAADARDGTLPGKKERPLAIREVLKQAGITLPEQLEIYGWLEYVQDYIAVSRQDDITSRIIIFLLFILSLLGIANTMLMAILERTKEIGMMRALGMTDGEVLLSYLVEAGLIGFLGGAIGMVLGVIGNIPMVNYGIDYSSMVRELGGDYGYRITSLFRSAWNPVTIFASGLGATLIAALLSILPTLRALRMPVTESLRFE
ncbi:MAG: FtsX-like permease family protein [Spirochaetales bacterium]